MAPVVPQDAPESTISGSGNPNPSQPPQQPARTPSFGRRNGLLELPDRSIAIDVTIPVEIAEPLRSQAESAQEDFETYVKRQIIEALEAYVSSQV